MKTCKTLLQSLVVVSALGAAIAGPAQAGSADEQLARELSQFKALNSRGAWFNPWMPAVAEPSGDERLQSQVAGYTRQALDRGGWSNPWVAGDHYAAGEPLLKVAVGGGVTSQGEAGPQRASVLQLAGR